jgi:hypothetical protein
VGFTYLSRVENERLDFAQFPSEELIRGLAKALDADEDELLLLAERIPEAIRKCVLQRPEAILTFATCDEETLDRLLARFPPTGHRSGTRRARCGRPARAAGFLSSCRP